MKNRSKAKADRRVAREHTQDMDDARTVALARRFNIKPQGAKQ